MTITQRLSSDGIVCNINTRLALKGLKNFVCDRIRQISVSANLFGEDLADGTNNKRAATCRRNLRAKVVNPAIRLAD